MSKQTDTTRAKTLGVRLADPLLARLEAEQVRVQKISGHLPTISQVIRRVLEDGLPKTARR